MASDISSLNRRKHLGFMTLLSSAVCEWFLIFLLFVDVAFSYFLRRFAQYCELKTPCPLCSRLDNIFGGNNRGSYLSLLCTNHREEISSLVSCSTHGKLADVHGLCEECLLPIAMQKNKSNLEPYRLLVGKMWVDIEQSVFQHLVVNKYINLGFSGRKTCLCCNRTWQNKSNAERLLEFTSIGLGASKAHVKPPLPRALGRSCFSRRDNLKRLRDKFTGQDLGNQSLSSFSKRKEKFTGKTSRSSNSDDVLSHLGYTKLKFASDSDSEIPLSEDEDDDDDGNARFRVKNYPNTKNDNVALAELKKQAYEVKPIIVDQPNLLDLSEHKIVNSSPTGSFIELDLKELNWKKSFQKPGLSLTSELISLDEGPVSSEVEGISVSESLPHMSAISVLSELLSLYNGPSLSNTVEIPENINHDEVANEKRNILEAKHVEAASTSDREITNQYNSLNQTGEYKKSSGIQEVDQINISDSAKTEDDSNSPPHNEVGLSSKDKNPRAYAYESTKDEGSNSQNLLDSSSLVRNSSYESLDGESVTDIEGESIVDRLKRQIEHDRTCMNSLYKELEEERNASSIAANEAMAMITRLQEEKAKLHMEALQYLRMMEEQAEYDMEALERANDLLAEKEKELQDLEFELEFYRNNLLDDESGLHSIEKESLIVKNGAENSPGYFSHSSMEISKTNGNSIPMNGSVSNFEDKKLYIMQCLKKLEEKLCEANFSGKLDEVPNGLISENEENSSFNSVSNGTIFHRKENECRSESQGEISSFIEEEIKKLHDRLQVLETDRDFLNHTRDVLRNGEDGLNFIEEIAPQLQELRKIEFKNR